MEIVILRGDVDHFCFSIHRSWVLLVQAFKFVSRWALGSCELGIHLITRRYKSFTEFMWLLALVKRPLISENVKSKVRTSGGSVPLHFLILNPLLFYRVLEVSQIFFSTFPFGSVGPLSFLKRSLLFWLPGGPRDAGEGRKRGWRSLGDR